MYLDDQTFKSLEECFIGERVETYTGFKGTVAGLENNAFLSFVVEMDESQEYEGKDRTVVDVQSQWIMLNDKFPGITTNLWERVQSRRRGQ